MKYVSFILQNSHMNLFGQPDIMRQTPPLVVMVM